MSNIRASCIGQDMRFTNTPTITSGDVNYDTITFDFCGQWDNFVKTAIFYRDENDVYYQLLDENNTCTIPKEVLTDKGTIYLGVFGVLDDVTLTSQVLTYRIDKGAITEDIKPSDPTPDIYDQILAQYNAILDNQADFIALQEQTMSDYQTAWLQTVANTRAEMIAEVNELVEQAKILDAETLEGHGASYFVPVEGEALTTSILEKAISVGVGMYNYRLAGASYTGDDLPHDNYAYGSATIFKHNNGSATTILWGEHSQSSIVVNQYSGISWSGWFLLATTTDLANYLPKSGGEINGSVQLISVEDVSRSLLLANSVRRVGINVNAGGIFNFWDSTNGKAILVSTLDGTNTFNGTATGNLPLKSGVLTALSDNAGGRLDFQKAPNASMSGNFALDITYANWVRMYETGGNMRGVHLNLNNCGNTYSSEILHTGNSSAVKISSTAPSDTSALWVVPNS